MSQFQQIDTAEDIVAYEGFDMKLADAIGNAQSLVLGTNKKAIFKFNNIDVSVTALDSSHDVIARYDQVYQQQRIDYENSPEYRKRREKAEKEKIEKKKQNALVDKLIENITLDITNQEAWDMNADRLRSTSYAIRWGKLMQAKMAQGKELEDIIQQSAFDANNCEISLAMHQKAAELLSMTWRHGEALKKFNHQQYQQ